LSRPADVPSPGLVQGDAARPGVAGANEIRPAFWPLIPRTGPPSERDYRSTALYLRLLMAEANGATECEIARDVFLNVKTNSPRLAWLAARSHLERARWLFENDFLPLMWAMDD